MSKEEGNASTLHESQTFAEEVAQPLENAFDDSILHDQERLRQCSKKIDQLRHDNDAIFVGPYQLKTAQNAVSSNIRERPQDLRQMSADQVTVLISSSFVPVSQRSGARHKQSSRVQRQDSVPSTTRPAQETTTPQAARISESTRVVRESSAKLPRKVQIQQASASLTTSNGNLAKQVKKLQLPSEGKKIMTSVMQKSTKSMLDSDTVDHSNIRGNVAWQQALALQMPRNSSGAVNLRDYEDEQSALIISPQSSKLIKSLGSPGVSTQKATMFKAAQPAGGNVLRIRRDQIETWNVLEKGHGVIDKAKNRKTIQLQQEPKSNAPKLGRKGSYVVGARQDSSCIDPSSTLIVPVRTSQRPQSSHPRKGKGLLGSKADERRHQLRQKFAEKRKIMTMRKREANLMINQKNAELDKLAHVRDEMKARATELQLLLKSAQHSTGMIAQQHRTLLSAVTAEKNQLKEVHRQAEKACAEQKGLFWRKHRNKLQLKQLLSVSKILAVKVGKQGHPYASSTVEAYVPNSSSLRKICTLRIFKESRNLTQMRRYEVQELEQFPCITHVLSEFAHFNLPVKRIQCHLLVPPTAQKTMAQEHVSRLSTQLEALLKLQKPLESAFTPHRDLNSKSDDNIKIVACPVGHTPNQGCTPATLKDLLLSPCFNRWFQLLDRHHVKKELPASNLNLNGAVLMNLFEGDRELSTLEYFELVRQHLHLPLKQKVVAQRYHLIQPQTKSPKAVQFIEQDNLAPMLQLQINQQAELAVKFVRVCRYAGDKLEKVTYYGSIPKDDLQQTQTVKNCLWSNCTGENVSMRLAEARHSTSIRVASASNGGVPVSSSCTSTIVGKRKRPESHYRRSQKDGLGISSTVNQSANNGSAINQSNAGVPSNNQTPYNSQQSTTGYHGPVNRRRQAENVQCTIAMTKRLLKSETFDALEYLLGRENSQTAKLIQQGMQLSFLDVERCLARHFYLRTKLPRIEPNECKPLICLSHNKKIAAPFVHIMSTAQTASVIQADLLSELCSIQMLIIEQSLIQSFSITDPDEVLPFERDLNNLNQQHVARLRSKKDQIAGAVSVIENYAHYLESFAVERELTILADHNVTQQILERADNFLLNLRQTQMNEAQITEQLNSLIIINQGQNLTGEIDQCVVPVTSDLVSRHKAMLRPLFPKFIELVKQSPIVDPVERHPLLIDSRAWLELSNERPTDVLIKFQRFQLLLNYLRQLQRPGIVQKPNQPLTTLQQQMQAQAKTSVAFRHMQAVYGGAGSVAMLNSAMGSTASTTSANAMRKMLSVASNAAPSYGAATIGFSGSSSFQQSSRLVSAANAQSRQGSTQGFSATQGSNNMKPVIQITSQHIQSNSTIGSTVIGALPDISREQVSQVEGRKMLNIQENIGVSEPRFASTTQSNSGTHQLRNPSFYGKQAGSTTGAQRPNDNVRNQAGLQSSHQFLGKISKFVNYKTGAGRGAQLRRQSTQTPVPVCAASRPQASGAGETMKNDEVYNNNHGNSSQTQKQFNSIPSALLHIDQQQKATMVNLGKIQTGWTPDDEQYIVRGQQRGLRSCTKRQALTGSQAARTHNNFYRARNTIQDHQRVKENEQANQQSNNQQMCNQQSTDQIQIVPSVFDEDHTTATYLAVSNHEHKIARDGSSKGRPVSSKRRLVKRVPTAQNPTPSIETNAMPNRHQASQDFGVERPSSCAIIESETIAGVRSQQSNDRRKHVRYERQSSKVFVVKQNNKNGSSQAQSNANTGPSIRASGQGAVSSHTFTHQTDKQYIQRVQKIYQRKEPQQKNQGFSGRGHSGRAYEIPSAYAYAQLTAATTSAQTLNGNHAPPVSTEQSKRTNSMTRNRQEEIQSAHSQKHCEQASELKNAKVSRNHRKACDEDTLKSKLHQSNAYSQGADDEIQECLVTGADDDIIGSANGLAVCMSHEDNQAEAVQHGSKHRSPQKFPKK